VNFASFGNSAYDYCDEGRYILFSSDGSHDILFEYTSKDLSELSDKFESYVSKVMNINTFELSDCLENDNECDELIKILRSIHPYYGHEYKTIFKKAVGDYLNALLSSSRFREVSEEKKSDSEWKEWYHERFEKLASSCLDNADEINGFYDDYIRMNRYDLPDDHEALIPVTSNAKGFSAELKTQEYIQWMLHIILDTEVPGIGKLTTMQRALLFEMIRIGSGNKKVKSKRTFSSGTLFRNNHDRSAEADQKYELEKLLSPIRSAFNNHVDYNKLEPEVLKVFDSITDYVIANSTSCVYEEYDIGSLEQLLYLEITFMAQAETAIRHCRHCGRYFVVTDRKKFYCDRKSSKTGEICSEVGSKRSWQNKVKDEPLLKMYNRARKTHYARVKYGIMSEDEYKTWLIEARKRYDEADKGKLNIIEYEKWLKK